MHRGSLFRILLQGALFLALLAALLAGLNRLLVPKNYLSNRSWPTTASINEFYAMETNSVDVLFLGSSVAVNHFAPQLLYDRFGIRAFNLGTEQQSILFSYWWLREALRFQSPKVVVLEGLFLQDCHPEFPANTSEGLTRHCLDPMRWSPVKLAAVRDVCQRDPSQSLLSYFFLNIRFHNRWKELSPDDFLRGGLAVSSLLGWAPGKNPPEFDTPFEPFEESVPDDALQLRPDMEEYFGKIAGLCREKGIRLILLKTPQEDAALHAAKLDAAYRNLAAQHDADFFNLRQASLFAQLGTDPASASVYGHGNLPGNLAVSDWMGRLLRDRYQVPAVRDPQYEGETRRIFNHVSTSDRLSRIGDVDEYLDTLSDDLFAVFISVRDEAVSGLHKSTKDRLAALGFRQKWSLNTMKRQSYLGIRTDFGLLEKTGGPVSASGLFAGGRAHYALSSSGSADAHRPMASIVIDGQEFAVNSRGLNIVVYDLYSLQVVDSVCFDTCKDASARRLE